MTGVSTTAEPSKKKAEEPGAVHLADILSRLPPMPEGWKPGDAIPGMPSVPLAVPLKMKEGTTSIPATRGDDERKVAVAVAVAPPPPPPVQVSRPLSAAFDFALNPDLEMEFDVGSSSESESSSDDDDSDDD